MSFTNYIFPAIRSQGNGQTIGTIRHHDSRNVVTTTGSNFREVRDTMFPTTQPVIVGRDNNMQEVTIEMEQYRLPDNHPYEQHLWTVSITRSYMRFDLRKFAGMGCFSAHITFTSKRHMANRSEDSRLSVKKGFKLIQWNDSPTIDLGDWNHYTSQNYRHMYVGNGWETLDISYQKFTGDSETYMVRTFELDKYFIRDTLFGNYMGLMIITTHDHESSFPDEADGPWIKNYGANIAGVNHPTYGSPNLTIVTSEAPPPPPPPEPEPDDDKIIMII